MKLVTFDSNGQPRVGLIHEDKLIDLVAAVRRLDVIPGGRGKDEGFARARVGNSMLELIERGEHALDAARAVLQNAASLPEAHDGFPIVHELSQTRLLAPIPRPPSMRDGYAFRQHVVTARKNRGLEMIPEFDQFPVFYFTNHNSVVGPGDVVVERDHLERLDYELEVAVVIAKSGSNWSVKEADASLFGLLVMNDWSARALQMEEMKLSLGPAKGKDFATSLGPFLVTLDELKDRTTESPRGRTFDLPMRAFINGKQLSQGNVKDMNWTFAEIVARASYGVTMHAGDVIGSGTCGTGCLLELNGSKITDNLWLKAGDNVRLEVDKLGVLENRIVSREGSTHIAPELRSTKT